MIGIHQEMTNEHFLKVSSKSDIAIMSNLHIRTPKLVHYQAEFLLLVNLRTSWGCANIRTNIICLYSNAKKTSNRYSKKLAIGTLTSETAKVYQYNSGILSPIQTKLSEYVYNILLISLQSLIWH